MRNYSKNAKCIVHMCITSELKSTGFVFICFIFYDIIPYFL